MLKHPAVMALPIEYETYLVNAVNPLAVGGGQPERSVFGRIQA